MTDECDVIQGGEIDMRMLIGIAICLMFLGCAPFVRVEDLSKVSQGDLMEASKIRIYTLETGPSYPVITEHLGEVKAYSCKFYPTDPPASKGDALKRLRLEALRQGADAVIDVTFDTRGTDAWGTNCWQSVQATGTAVRVKK